MQYYIPYNPTPQIPQPIISLIIKSPTRSLPQLLIQFPLQFPNPDIPFSLSASPQTKILLFQFPSLTYFQTKLPNIPILQLYILSIQLAIKKMIETLILSLPTNLTYQHLKRPLTFPQDTNGVSLWAFKSPLTIYSLDLAEKHQFIDGKTQINQIQHPTLEEKSKYFVMTKCDGRRIYCTSYVFYEKGQLKYQQNSQYHLKNTELVTTEFYLPKCLVLMSDKPYFKLESNLIQIHRQLRNNNPSIAQLINPINLQQYENQLKLYHKLFQGNLNQPIKTSLSHSAVIIQSSSQGKQKYITVPTQILWKYYISCCNCIVTRDKKYVCSINRLQILHLYNISQSLYRFNYFFYLPLSNSNLMLVIAAILLEKQIIFASNSSNSNVMLMQTLLEMIHPLKWQYMYVPNLPSSMLEAAQQCFIPFMVGVHSKQLDKINLKGKIVVHVDTDYLDTNQQMLQLPALLKSMYSYQQTPTNIPYLDWEKQTRIKSLLLMSTLLTQPKQFQRYCFQGKDYSFYQYFFEKSALYQTFKQQNTKQPNIEMNQLILMSLEDKIKTIESKFNMLQREATYPIIYENAKQLIKYYYYNHYGQNRNRLRNMKQSLVVYPNFCNNSIKTTKTNITTQINPISSPFSKQIIDKNHSFLKKGIGFGSDIKF